MWVLLIKCAIQDVEVLAKGGSASCWQDQHLCSAKLPRR